MDRRIALALGIALAAAVLAPRPAAAQCGGLCLYEVATPQQGSSYAGAAATAQDAATAYLNPAGMSLLPEGELLMGLYLAGFDINFDSNTNNTTPPPGGFTNDGGNAGAFLPGLGSYLVLPLADELGFLEDLRFGFAMNGIFGGAVDYDKDWIARTFITSVSLVILNLQPGISMRVTDWLSLGVSLNAFYAQLAEYRLRAGPGAGAQTLKADGADDWAFTYTLGALVEPAEGTRIGVNFRDDTKSVLTGGDAANFRYEFTLPRGVNVALYQQLTETVALLLDAGWTDWSVYSQQQITVGPLDVSIDRNFRDTWRVAGGFQWQAHERVLLQAGYSYDSSPVKDGFRTPDLPLSEVHRWSVGGQWDYSENLSFGLTYTFQWYANAKIDQVDLPPGILGVTLDGRYKDYWGQFVGLNLTWRFCSPIPGVYCPEKTKTTVSKRT